MIEAVRAVASDSREPSGGPSTSGARPTESVYCDWWASRRGATFGATLLREFGVWVLRVKVLAPRGVYETVERHGPRFRIGIDVGGNAL